MIACPDCSSTRVLDVTDQDDPIRMYFCSACSRQGDALEFTTQDLDEEADAADEQPSRVEQLVGKVRGLFKRGSRE